jgi:hypothetical protein|tara:strand:+ start:512 stop:673 length:162 start_codon:yes stop_codon:yes gene_type:complete
MSKSLIVDLLRIVLRDMKRRVEQNSNELERDKWGTFHDQIQKMIKTILEGGIK